MKGVDPTHDKSTGVLNHVQVNNMEEEEVQDSWRWEAHVGANFLNLGFEAEVVARMVDL